MRQAAQTFLQNSRISKNHFELAASVQLHFSRNPCPEQTVEPPLFLVWYSAVRAFEIPVGFRLTKGEAVVEPIRVVLLPTK